jgi:leader peptidase (prepilin peptidase)/N-methyltransferase
MVILSVTGAVLGLVVGSFVNVVAHRVPQGKSVVRPGSACPGCGQPIRARDNVPVVSWLLLRGRCRDCGTGISVRYPLVEAGTGLLFATLALILGPTAVLPAYWWFGAVALTLVLTDLDLKRIPNRILLPGTVVGTALLGIGAWIEGEPGALLRALAGGAGYFGLLFLLAVVARGGFGFGDVKFAFLLGEFLAYRSWGTLFVGAFAAFALGGIVAGMLLALRRVSRKDALPFGPALVAGALLALAVGERASDWYLG